MFHLDENEVLQYIDEYSLYCKYLEFEPDIKRNYRSPLRADDQFPSFGIFPNRYGPTEYLWKDSGGLGASGDVYRLVQLLFGYSTRWEAVQRVKTDFGMDGGMLPKEKIILHEAPEPIPADIRVMSRSFRSYELEWWRTFNISPEILALYRTSALYWYRMTPSQYAPVFPGDYSFVYRVYDRYQLYFPKNDKGRKFRNDLQPHHVMGLQQLTFQTPLLVITKSYKDVMSLRSFGYDAVSPRSENTPMPAGFFDWANKHYPHKLVLFDNDMKHRGDWYPYSKVYIPEDSGEKDVTDFCCRYGAQQTAQVLAQILRYE